MEKLITLYQKYISPFLPKSCRYFPTCSEYALQAYKKYNFLKATLKVIGRLLRCNPFFPGGYDPP